MRRSRARNRLLILGVLGILATLTLVPDTAAGATTQPSGTADKHVVVTPERDAKPLLKSTFKTIKGKATVDGGCSFRFPPLKLGPADTALESRQVSTDFTDCTTVVETGIPVEPSNASSRDEAEGTSDTERIGRLEAPRGPGQEAVLAVASAYFRVWWEDVINVRVTETRSNITWGYNGTCTTSVSGSGYWWWRSGTGWLRHAYGKNQSRTCSVAKVWSDATYKNGAFCWPGTVWNYYDNVEVRGWYNGTLGGSVARTWTTYPFACPTLHYHQQLRRT